MDKEISILDLNQKAESYLAQGKLKEADTTCNKALLKLEDIVLIYNTKGRVVEAMDNVSYQLSVKSELLNLVGGLKY